MKESRRSSGSKVPERCWSLAFGEEHFGSQEGTGLIIRKCL